LFMKHEREDFLIEHHTCDTLRTKPKSFELYEEYSQKSIDDTIRIHKENFEEADSKTKKTLEIEVKREVEDFRIWLEKTKRLEPRTAYYYSISLKSLLLGLSVGVQVAYLFDTVLDRLAIDSSLRCR